MFTIILSELQSWSKKYRFRSLIVLFAVMAVISIFTLIKPDLLLQTLSVFFVWLGWLSGRQSWSEVKFYAWSHQPKISANVYIAGKILSLVFLDIIHLFLISPVFVLIIYMWGMPLSTLILSIFIMILASIITFFLNFFFCRSGTGDYEYFGTLITSVWIIFSFFVSYVSIINPMFQIKSIIESATLVTSLLMISVNIGFLAVLYLITRISISLSR